MLKILHKDYKDKVKRLLSVMLPIIGTQIAIMGMNFLMPVCPVRQAMRIWPALLSAVISGCRCRLALQAFCWRRCL